MSSTIRQALATTAALVLGLTLPATAAAQQPTPRPHAPPDSMTSGEPTLEPGRRVRATLGPNVWVVGTLLERRDDVLAIRRDDRPVPAIQLSLTELDRVEVWGCCTGTGGFLKGAMIGAGLALVGGAVLQTLPSEAGPNMAMAGAVLVGVPIGVVLGGLIGRTAFRGEGWIEVAPGPPAPTSRPDPSGPGG